MGEVTCGGVGDVTGGLPRRYCMALTACTIPWPYLSSRPCVPLSCAVCSIASTTFRTFTSLLLLLSSKAATPDTWGQAIEVPERVAY